MGSGITCSYNVAMEPRIFSREPLEQGSIVMLNENAAAHAIRVLRLRLGDTLVVFDGSGIEYSARIQSVSRQRVSVAVGAGRDPGTESPIAVTLLQGICRSQRMDLLIQKSAELGVASVRPISCERSVVRVRDERALKKTEHWQQIAISACEQSGRVRVPAVARPATLADALGDLADDAGARLLLDPAAGQVLGAALGSPGAVALLIGPEGGLSAAERDTALDAGFQAVRMGPRTLRTETAPLVALSIVQYLAGDLGS